MTALEVLFVYGLVTVVLGVLATRDEVSTGKRQWVLLLCCGWPLWLSTVAGVLLVSGAFALLEKTVLVINYVFGGSRRA